MTAHGALAVIVVGLLSVGGGLVLYALVRSEHDRREETTRAEAERIARRDRHPTPGEGRSRHDGEPRAGRDPRRDDDDDPPDWAGERERSRRER